MPACAGVKRIKNTVVDFPGCDLVRVDPGGGAQVEYADNETQVKHIQESTSADERRKLLGELWADNLKLIRIIIRKVTGCTESEYDFQDLEQQAYFGFHHAAMNFNPIFGVKFFSYAEMHIKRTLNRCYNYGGLIRIPEHMRQQIRGYMKAKTRLETERGHGVTQEEVFRAMKVPATARNSIAEALNLVNIESLEGIRGNDDEGISLMDTLAGSADTETEAMEGGYHEELHRVLTAAIASTSAKQQAMIRAHWQQRRTYAEIAAAYGCTPENVRKHIKSGYASIRRGKYARELLTFLPEKTIRRVGRTVIKGLSELSEEERRFLM